MKFMVLCMLELGHLPSPRLVMDGLAGLGLSPVDSSPAADGLQYGPPDCVLGEFRAHDPHSLERQLHHDIVARLSRLHVEASFRLFVQPIEPALQPRAYARR